MYTHFPGDYSFSHGFKGEFLNYILKCNRLKSIKCSTRKKKIKYEKFCTQQTVVTKDIWKLLPCWALHPRMQPWKSRQDAMPALRQELSLDTEGKLCPCSCIILLTKLKLSGTSPYTALNIAITFARKGKNSGIFRV